MVLKIGVIGGSGLENPELLENFRQKEVETPFGKPSSPLTIGTINGIDVMIISRHGLKHEFPPTQVNNRANIFALKNEGCKFILATTAVGSLREDVKRGDFVILDQFIDFTKSRKLSFFEKFEFGPIHTPMANPFSDVLREKLSEACKKLSFDLHDKGTVVTIEGPRFSTKAESKMFRSFGADVINMSTSPEAILANEGEVPYAAIAMATDYDCWKESEEPVSWSEIKRVMRDNSERVKKVLLEVIDSFSKEQEILKLKEKVRTIPNFPKEGIMFRDITTLLQDRTALKKVAEIFCEKYHGMKIDAIAGIESRGFAIAGILAEKLDAGLVLVRKAGKLPAETVSESYGLEYGQDKIEIHKDAISPGQRILVIDDLLATGGTASASCKLVEQLGGEVVGCCFIIELPDLKGREKISKHETFSIMKFEGE